MASWDSILNDSQARSGGRAIGWRHSAGASAECWIAMSPAEQPHGRQVGAATCGVGQTRRGVYRNLIRSRVLCGSGAIVGLVIALGRSRLCVQSVCPELHAVHGSENHPFSGLSNYDLLTIASEPPASSF
jgi:hypothetical protein